MESDSIPSSSVNVIFFFTYPKFYVAILAVAAGAGGLWDREAKLRNYDCNSLSPDNK